MTLRGNFFPFGNLPAALFSGLLALTSLSIVNNSFFNKTIALEAFKGLTSLKELVLTSNKELAALATGLFDPLPNSTKLTLDPSLRCSAASSNCSASGLNDTSNLPVFFFNVTVASSTISPALSVVESQSAADIATFAAIGVFGSVLALLLLTLLYLTCCKYKENKDLPVPKDMVRPLVFATVSTLDFTTDVLFAVFNQDRSLTPFAAAVLALSTVINAMFVLHFMCREARQPAFREWLKEQGSVATAISVLSLSNTETLNVLKSRFLGLQALSAPFSALGCTQLTYCGLLSVFLEDLPQLAIQGYAIANPLPGMSASSLSYLSVSLTVLSIVFGLFKRALNCVVAVTASMTQQMAPIEM